MTRACCRCQKTSFNFTPFIHNKYRSTQRKHHLKIDLWLHDGNKCLNNASRSTLSMQLLCESFKLLEMDFQIAMNSKELLNPVLPNKRQKL